MRSAEQKSSSERLHHARSHEDDRPYLRDCQGGRARLRLQSSRPTYETTSMVGACRFEPVRVCVWYTEVSLSVRPSVRRECGAVDCAGCGLPVMVAHVDVRILRCIYGKRLFDAEAPRGVTAYSFNDFIRSHKV